MSTSSSRSSAAKKPAAAGSSTEETKTPTPTANSGDSGPGTANPEPPAEETPRPPATLVNAEGNPLDPPTDHKTQTDPEQGTNEGSTDHVYAATGGRTVAGEDFHRLVGEDGKKLSEGSIFDDAGASKTFVVTKQRVYEEFYYPNTTEVARRLLFAEGKRVPRAQAEKIKEAVKNAPEPAAKSYGD